jgi:hypothetical protein
MQIIFQNQNFITSTTYYRSTDIFSMFLLKNARQVSHPPGTFYVYFSAISKRPVRALHLLPSRNLRC